MKTLKTLSPILLSLSLLSISACSTGSKSADDLAYTGPTVLDAKTNPGTFELNRQMTPKTEAQVVADVKDFNAKITDVRLRFVRVPVEIPMKLSKDKADQWVADLSKDQLRELAVAGHTMNYDANIIAKNSKGQVATSKKPINVAVKAPDVVPDVS
jgi:ABC-type glycerol-3-phosphate transport system substrate-binding protein